MKLIFVYNADSGLFNTVSDIAHKTISPKTYSCNLCALTHGHFKIKKDWVNFLDEIEAELEFLHRDEFLKQGDHSGTELPAIFIVNDNELSLWLDHKTINQIESLDELKTAILKKIT